MSRSFDFLINAEVIVDDVKVAERVFVEALGFPEPRPTWGSSEPGYGFTYLFARVHPSLSVSPTRIEAMALSTLDPAIDPQRQISFLSDILAAQGDRPWKTHGNELAASDIDTVEAALRRNGCPVHTMPRDEIVPFARLWLGWDDVPVKYHDDVDGGLFVELVEMGPHLVRLPEFWEVAPDPELPPGSMTRVARRSWLVPDLDATLAALERNLDWKPTVASAVDEERGGRRAVFTFRHPRSAELELFEPVEDGEARESLTTWGPGSWAIRIVVNDVDAKAADLRRRGTAFDALQESGRTVLRVDTGPLGAPGLFEFAEAAN
jgi:hypothetical protein